MKNPLFLVLYFYFLSNTLVYSFSEDEFENNREDKYVFLERKYKMFCTFHKKLRKWIPEKIANETLIISTIYQVKSFI